MTEPIRFELDRLVSYDDTSLIAEVQRVSSLVPGAALTRSEFDSLSRASSSTVIKRFGDWRSALDRAGLSHRYGGRTVSQRMRDQRTKSLSDEDLLDELRRVAKILGTNVVSMEAFTQHSDGVSAAGVVRRFGSWGEALRRAGLELSSRGRRWTDDDYFENLLAVWTHYGRAPTYSEMNVPPSKITNGGYEKKFGTWVRAKAAFVERVNSDLALEQPRAVVPRGERIRVPDGPRAMRKEDRRTPSLGLRYQVLSRDRFRCTICGRSPANDLTVELHVDHVVPVAAGGKTVEENLRALCSDCNLGKGARLEPPDVRHGRSARV